MRDAERRSAADLNPQRASTFRDASQVEAPGGSQLVVGFTWAKDGRRPWRPAVLLQRAQRVRHAEKRRRTRAGNRRRRSYLDRWKKRRTGRRTNFWNASHPAYTSDQTDMPEAYSLSDARIGVCATPTLGIPCFPRGASSTSSRACPSTSRTRQPAAS